MEYFESMMSAEDFNARVKLPELYPGDLKSLPSIEDEDISILKHRYYGRREYIKHLGYTLLTKEFASELQEIFKDLNINSFVEIEAGAGALSVLLNNVGLTGKGYTLDPESGEDNWGMGQGEIFQHARSSGMLEFADIRELELQHKPDIVVASWIPYMGGDEVIEFFKLQDEVPEYFLVIGEGYSGCTASDEFHDWLEDTFEEVWESETHTSFSTIHDSVKIFKKKG